MLQQSPWSNANKKEDKHGSYRQQASPILLTYCVILFTALIRLNRIIRLGYIYQVMCNWYSNYTFAIHRI